METMRVCYMRFFATSLFVGLFALTGCSSGSNSATSPQFTPKTVTVNGSITAVVGKAVPKEVAAAAGAVGSVTAVDAFTGATYGPVDINSDLTYKGLQFTVTKPQSAFVLVATVSGTNPITYRALIPLDLSNQPTGLATTTALSGLLVGPKSEAVVHSFESSLKIGANTLGITSGAAIPAGTDYTTVTNAVLSSGGGVVAYGTTGLMINGGLETAAHAVSFRFAMTDDSRASGGAAAVNNGVSTAVVAAIAKDIAAMNSAQGIDFVLFPGDMVSGYADTVAVGSMLDTWKATMKPVYDANIPVYTARGNHEYYDLALGAPNAADPSRTPYLAKFLMPSNGPTTNAAGLSEVGLTYSFTYKNAKIIAFDEYAGRLSTFDNTKFAAGSNKGQMVNPWVLNEINNSTAGVNFVMGHEGLWPTKSHPDTLGNDPDSRDALITAMSAKNGTFLTGHDHMFVRATVKNGSAKVPQLLVGTGGGGNYDFGVFNTYSAGYKGATTYTPSNHYSNSKNPYFGYIVVTVYTDNTWSAQFRGFQFNSWNSATDISLTPITVMDSFTSADFYK